MLHIMLCDAFNITWYIILRATFQKPYNNVSVLYVSLCETVSYHTLRYYIDKNSWSHTNAHKIYINMIYSWKTAHFYWFQEHIQTHTKCNRIGKECAALCVPQQRFNLTCYHHTSYEWIKNQANIWKERETNNIIEIIVVDVISMHERCDKHRLKPLQISSTHAQCSSFCLFYCTKNMYHNIFKRLQRR